MASLLNWELRDPTDAVAAAAIARIESNPGFPTLKRLLQVNCTFIGVPISLIQACDPDNSPAWTPGVQGSDGVNSCPPRPGLDVYSDAFDQEMLLLEQKLRADLYDEVRRSSLRGSRLLHYFNSTLESFRSEIATLVDKLGVAYFQGPYAPSRAYLERHDDGSHLIRHQRYNNELHSMTVYYRQRRRLLHADVSQQLERSRRSTAIGEHSFAVPRNPIQLKPVRTLSQMAIKAMRTWYDLHFQSPYPTDEEKADLARQCNITISQVKSWFANKRNRTFNTKPMRQKREMQLLNDNNNNNNSDSNINNNINNNGSNKIDDQNQSIKESKQLVSEKNNEALIKRKTNSGALYSSSAALPPLTVQLTDQGNRRPLANIQPRATMTLSPRNFHPLANVQPQATVTSSAHALHPLVNVQSQATMTSPAHDRHPLANVQPQATMTSPAHDLHPLANVQPQATMTSPAHDLHPLANVQPQAAVTSPAHNLHPLASVQPQSPVSSPSQDLIQDEVLDNFNLLEDFDFEEFDVSSPSHQKFMDFCDLLLE